MTLQHIALTAVLAAYILVLPGTARAQQSFPTPAAAADALVDGIARHDDAAVEQVLGQAYAKYVPKGSVDANDVTRFLEAWAKSHRIIATGDAKAYVEVGTHGWTLPIPLEKTTSGWRFDTAGTADELRTRRIGRNELDVIQVMLALGDAQDDYAAANRARAYAQRILSSQGKRDGLYWPTPVGEAPSPLGPIADNARPGDSYHGYHYRLLKAQGKDAPGGAMSYVKDGKMTDGYAFIAWPAKPGDTGVMSFIVSKAGEVYQKDLGLDSGHIARSMTAFNPGATWTRVQVKP